MRYFGIALLILAAVVALAMVLDLSGSYETRYRTVQYPDYAPYPVYYTSSYPSYTYTQPAYTRTTGYSWSSPASYTYSYEQPAPMPQSYVTPANNYVYYEQSPPTVITY